MNMNLRDMQYFAVVAEHRHVGRAAEALGLSQPALSMSLRRLEQAVGTKLVKRMPKGVEVTAAGAALLPRVHRLRLAFDDVAQEVADIAHGYAGQVRIGAVTSFIHHPVSAACKALYETAPNVTLTVRPETADSSTSTLCKGELDLIVRAMSGSLGIDLVEDHLFDDEFVVISSFNHRLAGRKRVTIADLAQEKWVFTSANGPSTRRVYRGYKECGMPPPRIAMITASLTLRDDLVASTDLLGYSSTRVAREASPRVRFAEFRVKGLERIRGVSVVYRKDAYLSPAAQRFIQILKTVAKEFSAKGTNEKRPIPKVESVGLSRS